MELTFIFTLGLPILLFSTVSLLLTPTELLITVADITQSMQTGSPNVILIDSFEMGISLWICSTAFSAQDSLRKLLSLSLLQILPLVSV